MFPRQPMKCEETFQRRQTTRATMRESNLPSWIDNPQSNNIKQEGSNDSNYSHIKAQDKTRTEHIRSRTQSL
jgi:replication initiation and membrane attachment protein DnaB